jgi:hypothetical protein
MLINVNQESKQFHLTNGQVSYIFHIMKNGWLGHLYYVWRPQILRRSKHCALSALMKTSCIKRKAWEHPSMEMNLYKSACRPQQKLTESMDQKPNGLAISNRWCFI